MQGFKVGEEKFGDFAGGNSFASGSGRINVVGPKNTWRKYNGKIGKGHAVGVRASSNGRTQMRERTKERLIGERKIGNRGRDEKRLFGFRRRRRCSNPVCIELGR